MFHSIPEAILARMRDLEQIDGTDRQDGTPRQQRLRQIPPETGKFLALLAAGAPKGHYVEIGTSAGYSTLWLALACALLGRTITTFEVLPEKVRLDKALLSGSLLFGVGWGWAGLCPGPAIVASGFADPRIWVFTAAMVAGMALVRLVRRRTTG